MLQPLASRSTCRAPIQTDVPTVLESALPRCATQARDLFFRIDLTHKSPFTSISSMQCYVAFMFLVAGVLCITFKNFLRVAGRTLILSRMCVCIGHCRIARLPGFLGMGPRMTYHLCLSIHSLTSHPTLPGACSAA